MTLSSFLYVHVLDRGVLYREVSVTQGSLMYLHGMVIAGVSYISIIERSVLYLGSNNTLKYIWH